MCVKVSRVMDALQRTPSGQRAPGGAARRLLGLGVRCGPGGEESPAGLGLRAGPQLRSAPQCREGAAATRLSPGIERWDVF